MNTVATFIRLDPFILPLLLSLAFVAFVMAAPILVTVALILTARRSTRRVGTIMLLSGGAGFVCMAAAAVIRIWSKPNYVPATIDAALRFGLAGISAFIVVAMLIHFRTHSGLTNR